MSQSGGSRSFLVECYWPGVTEEKLATATRRVREISIELSRGGRNVELLGSILVPADETVFCVFEGREADVRTASERAGIPFERVLESLRIDGEPSREEEK